MWSNTKMIPHPDNGRPRFLGVGATGDKHGPAWAILLTIVDKKPQYMGGIVPKVMETIGIFLPQTNMPYKNTHRQYTGTDSVQNTARKHI